MNLFKKKEKTSKEKILESKEIIKQEKDKIRMEKEKIKKEKRKNKKTETYNSKELVITIIISMLAGAICVVLAIFIILNKKHLLTSYKDLSKLIDTYTTITNEYYGEIDKEELVNEAINSMVNSLGDNFTTYSNTKDTEAFLEDVEGTYEGIGCTISTTLQGEITVVSVFENSPSFKAGLKEKDIITKIDDKEYTGKNSLEASEYIKKNTNKKIKLTILRDGEEKEIIITRSKVEVPVVTSKVIEKDNHKLGYIYISLFTSVSNIQFEKELKKIEKENIEGLIIDVRGNGGGYLTSVTDIASLFLKKGSIIYQLQNDNKIEKVKDATKEKRNYKVAVLIDKVSASASEILASAIKESYNGFVVGTNSYGKGTVQQTKKLKDGSMIKFTAQNWLTPQGNFINEVGVTPTNYIEYDINSESDNQLEEAVKAIIETLN